MVAKVILFSYKYGEINNFLSKYYISNVEIEESLSWQKDFSNPVDMSDLIGVYADNIDSYELTMWISLDADVFIKITDKNVNNVIKYLLERYPY